MERQSGSYLCKRWCDPYPQLEDTMEKAARRKNEGKAINKNGKKYRKKENKY